MKDIFKLVNHKLNITIPGYTAEEGREVLRTQQEAKGYVLVRMTSEEIKEYNKKCVS